MFWFAALAAFLGWVMLSTSPNERFIRACAPVRWTGNVTLSIAAVLDPTGEAATKEFFDKSDYVCRYTFWRLFYGHAWEQEQNRLRGGFRQGLPQTPSAAHPPSGRRP
jgi:hypothetical protein